MSQESRDPTSDNMLFVAAAENSCSKKHNHARISAAGDYMLVWPNLWCGEDDVVTQFCETVF
jgi:hypothetical protein